MALTVRCPRCEMHRREGRSWRATGHVFHKADVRRAELQCTRDDCDWTWSSSHPDALAAADALRGTSGIAPVDPPPVRVPAPMLPLEGATRARSQGVVGVGELRRRAKWDFRRRGGE